LTYRFFDNYKILDISFGASQDEIRQAYKKKVKETHPDLGGNEEAFINVRRAYDVLQDPKRKRHYDIMYQQYYQEKQQESHKNKKQSNHQERRAKHGKPKTYTESSKSKEHEPKGPENKNENNTKNTKPLRTFIRVAGIVMIVFLFFVRIEMTEATKTTTIDKDISYNTISEKSESSIEDTGSGFEENKIENDTQTDTSNTNSNHTEKEDFEVDLDTDVEEEIIGTETFTNETDKLSIEEISDSTKDEQKTEDHHEAFTSSNEPIGTFSLGSSQEEVKSVMGTPTSISSFNNSWDYEYSTVHFDSNNKVIGWSDISNNLKAFLGNAEVNATFSLGSSKQEVVDAMGTPTSVSTYDNSWEYGYSQVRFNYNHQVTGWSDISNNLKVYLGDALPKTTFTVGSSKQEVIEAMGTPTSISTYDNSWGYKYSTVKFDDNDNVESWSNISKNLKLQ
jgi:curved DNA-binding protein CbpA/outer membrane protein assembly factor BamE (lipoprotein component of BamABCDE complex)